MVRPSAVIVGMQVLDVLCLERTQLLVSFAMRSSLRRLILHPGTAGDGPSVARHHVRTAKSHQEPRGSLLIDVSQQQTGGTIATPMVVIPSTGHMLLVIVDVAHRLFSCSSI